MLKLIGEVPYLAYQKRKVARRGLSTLTESTTFCFAWLGQQALPRLSSDSTLSSSSPSQIEDEVASEVLFK